MVAVNSAYKNKFCEFNFQPWIETLEVASQQSKKILNKIFGYVLQTTHEHPDAKLLLWREVEMVQILSMLRSMNIDPLCAALLLPLPDTNVKVINQKLLPTIVENYIVNFIHSVHNIVTISQIKAINVDNIGISMLLALTMVDDLRYLVIKLAERIIYLREGKYALKYEQVQVAKECIKILALLANRLDIDLFKWKLEDYCFKYLYPAEYKHIAKLLHERRIYREYYIDDFVSSLRKAMTKNGVNAEVYGRPKNIYSIWRKMHNKHLAFNEIFDLRAVRIIADKLQDCYAALDIVHTNFSNLQNEFYDYVANPKPNGYQSIHTVVLGPGGKTVEIQIRSKQMHENAELGVAAHWKYKKGISLSYIVAYSPVI